VSNVSPQLSGLDLADMRWVQTEFQTYLPVTSCRRSYFKNLLCGKFRVPVGLSKATPSSCRSPLCDTICYVIGVGSEEKVSDLATDSIVTTMKDMHPIRDLAIAKFPRNSVSNRLPSMRRDLPVSVPINASSPQEASCIWIWSRAALKSDVEWPALLPLDLHLRISMASV
jgi:hypothetical protein